MQFCDDTNWISMASGFSDVPTGFIGAFNLATCPAGWSEYTLARGRFLRGIDSTGTNDPDGVRALGSVQDDDFESHRHTAGLSTDTTPGSGSGIASGNNNALAGTTNQINNTGGAETRPKNVAVLYCEKS